MAALSNLPYPFPTFISQIKPQKLTIRSSIRVLTKRKNYLRPKILKTLTKPYPIPSPTPEDPVTQVQISEPCIEAPCEPNLTQVQIFEPYIEAPCEPNLENLDFEIVEESEVLGTQVSEGPNALGFRWFSGRMVVRIVASFVGLFVLQTVVAVWVAGTDEKGNLKFLGEHMDTRLGIREPNGNLASMYVDESEVQEKIAEIRKLAREAREIEKRTLENREADPGYTSDDDDDDEEEDLHAKTSRVRSGIVKEVDGRLTKLRKQAPKHLVNSNLLNNPRELTKEAKNEDLGAKEENNTLMFEMKPRFKNNMRSRDKPKGFQSIKDSRDVKGKPRNKDNQQPTKRAGNPSGSIASSSDGDREINGLDSSFPEIDEKKLGSPNSSSSLNLTKKTGNNSSETREFNKGSNSSATTQSNSAKKKFNNIINEGAKTERGVVQESRHGNPGDQGADLKDSSPIATQSSQIKVNNLKESTTSEVHTLSEPLSSHEHKKTLSVKKLTDKQPNGDLSPWWLSLPCAFVILMRKNSQGEGMEGFYTLRVHSDTEKQSYKRYIVAFEAPNDARNFSYLLESVFENLPDAAIDMAPLPTKELKEIAESIENEVIVVKKGELKLYAGQPLDEVDTALRSLIN